MGMRILISLLVQVAIASVLAYLKCYYNVRKGSIIKCRVGLLKYNYLICFKVDYIACKLTKKVFYCKNYLFCKTIYT